MAYKMEINGRTIYLAQKAETPNGDYIVYEWNDGVFIGDYDDDDDDDDDDFIFDDELDEDFFEDEFYEDDEEPVDDEIVELELGEEEDEVEEAVRLDIEAMLSAGFVPQGGVSALITPEYTTCYTQAFFRKK